MQVWQGDVDLNVHADGSPQQSPALSCTSCRARDTSMFVDHLEEILRELLASRTLAPQIDSRNPQVALWLPATTA